jgi:hypothetical protein
VPISVSAMTFSALEWLVGHKVVALDADAESFALLFEGGGILRIQQPHVASPALDERSALVRATVTAVRSGTESAEIAFDNGLRLVLDLRDERYAGPEAFVMELPGRPIVVG